MSKKSSSASEDARLPNLLMDRYQMQPEVVCTSLFGAVYAGIDTFTQEEVVVKQSDLNAVLSHRAVLTNKLVADNPLAECKIMEHVQATPHDPHFLMGRFYIAQLNTSFLYPTNDNDPSKGYQHCMVMPRYSRGELFHHVQRSRMTESVARIIARQLLLALRFLHEDCQVCHLDLSLENILLDGNLQPKICDFGSAQVMRTPVSVLPQVIRPGKPHSIPPEMYCLDAFCGFKADMWAFGIALYMMVTTSQPFPGGLYVADPTCRSTLMMNPDHRARLIMSNCIDKILLQLFRGISKDLASFIQRLVKVDPAERLTARQAMDDPWVTNGGAESKWYSAMPLLSAEDVLSKPMPSKISVNTLSEVIDHGNANCKMDETTPVAVAKCEVRSDTATPLTCR